MLYHYTPLKNFKSIVGEGELWAFHYRNLKGDKHELDYGIERLRNFLKTHPVVEDDKAYKQHLLDVVDVFASGDLPVFVTSFTELADSPHHWSTYAPEGVAIGFDPVIRKGFPVNGKPYPGHRFMQCRYEHEVDLASVVEKRFFTPNSYPAAFRNPTARDHWAFSAPLAVSVYQAICTLKAGKHVDDREWRCVVIEPDEKHPIQKVEGLAPFIKLQFDPAEFVRKVVVGKHAKAAECSDAVRQFEGDGRLILTP